MWVLARRDYGTYYLAHTPATLRALGTGCGHLGQRVGKKGSRSYGFAKGAVPEVVCHGITGFVVNDLAEAEAAVPEVYGLDRRCRRRWVEKNFSAEAMVDGYLAAYKAVLDLAR
ncbi:MAG: hypothetical protein PWQ13_272 [Bacillota bacterium]|nr:hypothetical protein [Bacillota bacterium]